MNSQPSEVINCPNCKEDVPKTLYCLNCGYPLYKLEQKKIEDTAEEPETQAEAVDMSVEIEQPEIEETGEEQGVETDDSDLIEEEIEEIETVIEVEEETEEESEEEPEPMIEVEEETEPIVEVEPELEPMIEVQEEPEEEPEFTLEAEPEPEPIIEVEEEPESIVEVEPEPIVEVEPEPEPIIEVEEEPEEEPEFTLEAEPELEPMIEVEEETEEELESYIMDEIKIEFAPDPLTKEVMESLAKNITLKIRLVRLLRENQVKEETFKKLFDSYVEQGRLWVSRRDEIIKRFKADIGRMEDELVTARKDFELLEIRKNIGDASEQEYSVKAPAYKWDIENLDNEIKNTRGGIQYVINLKGLIPDEEIAELKAMDESGYSELDEIEGVSPETIAQMKESLAEALASLER
jgi:hypothetical protein